MRTLDDAIGIDASLTGASHLIVVGAGFIGSEVASSARSRGLDVTIIEVAEEPLVVAVGVEVGVRCASLHERYGTELRLGIGVTAVEPGPEGLQVDLSDGSTAGCDAAVVGIGVVPNTEWLSGSGIAVDNGVVCDQYMAASMPGVYAVGDLASWHNPLFDRQMRVEHWTNTVEQAVAVARNIADPVSPSAYAGVPYFWSDQYGHRLQLAGRTDADEVIFFDDDAEGPATVALYRKGDELRGAFAIDGVGTLMKLRGLVMRKAPFDEAVSLVRDASG
jgi:NADPH-dependent 2,4-dienoyl-CoA reductase/sulfur reductase-like enzyme